jgi:hypothetical protein
MNNAVKAALLRTETWIQTSLVPALVYGGFGITGIAQTPFYVFISSDEGLSQLGIKPSDPPKLLKAYLNTFKTRRSGTTLQLQFGNIDLLKQATPHPFNKTGKLRIKSWLEWVEDGRTVSHRGYVNRSSLPRFLQKKIRLSAPLGGLMLPKGAYRSSGFWQFPRGLQDYEIAWLNQNMQRIHAAIEKNFAVNVQRSLN